MGRRGLGGMGGVTCLALSVLAVWPVGPLERGLDRLCMTTRPLLQVARSTSWLGQVHASDDELIERWDAEMLESAQLERWVQEQAVPLSVHLGELVTLHAEAVGRPEGELDSLLVRVWRSGMVRPGMPVTTGDHYVGMVRSVRERKGPDGDFDDVTVELITSSKARIAAGVFSDGDWHQDSHFVVGGLLSPKNFGLGSEREVLAVHHPSKQGLREGKVLVNESPDGERDSAKLANGFQLGILTLAPEPDERTRMDFLGVLPGVDFESGLYQVLIHTGMSLDAAAQGLPEEGAPRGRWMPVTRVSCVDPAPWREGFKLLSGSRHGVQLGAAVAHGARLVGRVERTGFWNADVQGPGDRGFYVPAIALWKEEGATHPTFVMGRMKSLGRDRKGRLRWLWPAALPKPSEGSALATLYTGSGEPGVPRGLLIGETEIPSGPGPHELLIDPPADSEVWDHLEIFQYEKTGQ